MPERQDHNGPVLAIDVVEDGGDWSVIPDCEALVQKAASALAAYPGVLTKNGSVAVALSTDVAIAKLNASFRGKDKPTNVLSFPAGPTAPAGELGDIVLALETITREAVDLDIPLEHHLQHLVVHGMLHLLGHEHETATDAEVMETLEIRILAKLGVHNPYTGDLEDATVGMGDQRRTS